MLLGGWLASPAGVTPRAAASPLTLAALGAVYVGAKLAMVHGVLGRAYPLLHVLTFAICACMFAVFTSARCVGWARSVRPVWAVASFVGALTLELYLVHSPIATYEWLWRVPFPANIAVFWLLTLPLAVLAGRVGARLQRLVGATESSAAPTRPPDRPADDLGARVSRAGR
jgi:peptidoglycan/LPS O-acetylase OafA/YrhL